MGHARVQQRSEALDDLGFFGLQSVGHIREDSRLWSGPPGAFDAAADGEVGVVKGAFKEFHGKGVQSDFHPVADQAAVDSMRKELNNIPFDGEVVIGEGEMDEAPMLYIGEKLGLGGDISVDIAVDPLDGTKLAADNKPNAVSVIAISNSNCFLRAPDMYMEKISVGPELPNNIINFEDPLTKNIERLAKAKKKDIINIKVCLLDRPRHKKQIDILKNMNCKLKLISDGDVVGAMQASLHDSDVDMYLGTGGAPEGVLAAAAIK